MCATVWDEAAKRMLISPDDLAEALGGRDKVKIDAHYDSITWDSCLCQVDVEKSIEGAGHSWQPDAHDSMRVVMTK